MFAIHRTSLIFACLLVTLLGQTNANADLLINVGQHVLFADQANQRIDIIIVSTNNERIQGLNLRARLGDGNGPITEPVFQGAVGSLDGVLFTDGPGGTDYIWDSQQVTINGFAPGTSGGTLGAQYAAPNVSLLNAASVGPIANGIVASLFIDTTGIQSGQYAFNLVSPELLSTNATVGLSTVPVDVENGFITVVSAVPEPSSFLFASAVVITAGVAVRRKRKKLATSRRGNLL